MQNKSVPLQQILAAKTLGVNSPSFGCIKGFSVLAHLLLIALATRMNASPVARITFAMGNGPCSETNNADVEAQLQRKGRAEDF